MSTINEIKKILGDGAPAHLGSATETPDGVMVPTKIGKSTGWNQFYEERALGKALAPLADNGWTIEPGPVSFGKNVPNVLIVRPPAPEGIDTATLPLRDRVRVEGKMGAGTSAGNIVDALEVNEDTREITFDSTGAGLYQQRQISEMVDNLRETGWTGPIGHRFGKSGIYGTLTAPAQGMKVQQPRINAFLLTRAEQRTSKKSA